MADAQQPTNEKRTAWGMATIVFTVTLAAYIARVNVSVALPYISQDFGWDQVEAALYGGLLLGIFLAGYGISNIFLSPLVDHFGPRKSLLVAVAVFSVLTFLTGLVGLVFAFLIIARILLGFAQGIVYPSASKVTQAWFQPRQRSKVNALHLSAMEWSNLLVPIFLIPIIILTDWRYAFFAVAILCALVLVPVFLYLRDCPECERIRRHEHDQTLRQLMGKAMKDLRAATKIKGIFILSAADAAGNLVWWGISLWLPSYLFAIGLTQTEVIWVASLPYLGGIAGLLIGSFLSDRTGKVIWITFAFQMVGALAVLLLIGTTTAAAIMMVLAFLFFFIALFPPNAFTLLQGIAPPELMGSATGLMNGIAVGMGVFGPIILGMAVAATGSYSAGFIIMAIMQVLSAILLICFARSCKLKGRSKPI
ncbi:MAG: MFS transporter [Methanomassiliicoccales archaeon]|nr:MFS transporter [Methanomassiliicoccales archaeon]MDD1755413.1 MFS transporter [Methanomassiliicoccales archaeon]